MANICSIFRNFTLAILAILFMAFPAYAAIGCDLNDPSNDVPRLFPESSNFKSVYVGLDSLHQKSFEARIGERFKALYEPINVPYTLYEIYNGKKKIGYIHGVNQKGQFGVIQVFVSLDLKGMIKTFYIQKMTGQWAKKLRDPKFGRQFIGLSLKDFDTYNPATGKGTGKFAEIRNPAPEGETDFYAVMRGVMKNLALMNEFVFSAEREKP